MTAKAGEPSNPHGVSIAYFDDSSRSGDHILPILLLHGSPQAAEATFKEMIPALGKVGRVIAPDLPGFGASSRSVSDYSIRSHAEYMIGFLGQLGINSAHIVAYSMGGGVALHMAHMAPDRIRSITMLSAIGVQEFEMLGNYTINHALHGAQLALIWLITNGFPHMGLLDRIPLNLYYARNFYETDQRPLRKYLIQYQSPMLILHGRKDSRIPLTAAQEHHRLVPQSELKIYDRGHLIPFSNSGQITSDISDFIKRVEEKEAKTRAQVDTFPVAEARSPLNEIDLPPINGLALIIVMVLIALATLISEDLTCIGAGLLAARGTIGLVPAVIASFAGIFFGDILLYLAGKYLGRSVLGYPPFKWMIKDEDVTRASRWFSARGPIIIITSRFLPGSRLPTYFSAGVLDTGFWRFALYFSVAAALWTPLLVGLSALIGGRMLDYYNLFSHYGILIFLATAFLIWLTAKFVVPLFSFRGRRLLLSSIRRKTRYEFWNTYIFYIPIYFYCLYLSLRFRSLTLFTLSNPGIPEGGFNGESKSQILNNLKGNDAFIARFRLIKFGWSTEKKINRAIGFMHDIGSAFPIVLKPDAGQRGQGVAIIKSKAQLECYLADTETDVIIQEYAAGYEYGVFYYRYPDKNTGHIFSITDKRRPTLIGDGKSTLEELILKDDRAVCLARFHMQVHQEDLYRIPEKGEEVMLVEVGAHARGTVFMDGNHMYTPKLEAAIDKISKGFKGFYFGRYDMRTPSKEDFKNGKNFKIVELNGVTAEAGHIYNPGNSIWYAYKILMQQWKVAYEIGAINRQRGHEPATLKSMLKLVIETTILNNHRFSSRT